MELNKKLRELRKERGINQKDVAKALGITLSAYAHYEQGARIPSLQIIVNLCKYFEVSADYLLGLED